MSGCTLSASSSDQQDDICSGDFPAIFSMDSADFTMLKTAREQGGWNQRFGGRREGARPADITFFGSSTMKYLSHSLLMGALITLSGIVSAQPPDYAGRGPLPFAAFDQNGDGAISQQEFDAAHAQRRQAPNPGGNSARRIMDPPQFAAFDQNGDGYLSPQELAQGQQMRRTQRQPGGAGWRSGANQAPGMGRGMGPRGGPGMQPGRGRQMPSFESFDLNGDGVLHQQEFEQARAQRIRQRLEQGYQMRNLQNAPPFSSVDANGDGVISAQEFAAAQAMHRQP